MIARHRTPRGFTLTEVLVVLALIVVLLGLLLPALSSVVRGGQMTESMANMRTIASWMRLYAQDNRETIVPSRFDYSGNSYKGKVRSIITSGVGVENEGTWTDILWTVFEPATFPETAVPGAQPPCDIGHDYRFDSPDQALYDCKSGDVPNPLRSAAPNTFDFAGSGFQGAGQGMPKPFGPGATDMGRPGYFAANNFFDSTSNGWFTTGEIKLPERSMYLVDSFAGETIDAISEPYDTSTPPGDPGSTQEVDFRYNDVCLMLFLDGHVDSVAKWQDLADLEGKRQIRITNLP